MGMPMHFPTAATPFGSDCATPPAPWWQPQSWREWWSARRTPEPAQAQAPERPHRDEDTVAAWPPEAARVLGHAERRVHTALIAACPEHWVWPQVPLSRLVRVPTRRSYAEWVARTGYLCVDFAVCDLASRPVAVVLMPAEGLSARAMRRRLRLVRVLQAAGVGVLGWDAERYTCTAALRAAINSAKPAQTPWP